MRALFAAFLVFFAIPFALSAREGTPFYYQNPYAAQYQQAPSPYPGQNIWIGNQPSRQVVGQRSYSYQVPRQNANPWAAGGGAMTPNGVAMPRDNNPYDVGITGHYAKKFADFTFETGVQSILHWNNMLIDEIGFRLEKEFNLRGYNVVAFGEYSTGKLTGGGMSMDYDLKPYDDAVPWDGIFTISMGGQSGTMQNMKFGIGPKHIWDVSGWKITPIVGYQIFKHDMKMNDHIYPNPAVYIPLMNQFGDYIFGDGINFINVPQGMAAPNGYYQVCMSPEDLMLAASDSQGRPLFDSDGNIITADWMPNDDGLPWGVGPGDCVVIGGDGLIMVPGVTHIYNTTWSGIFLGLEIEKQMTYVDKLRFYVQASMPHYRSEGTWPNRTDWQQNPSFLDEGDTGALHYQAEIEYVYQFSDRMQLSLKAEGSYFHIGQVGGELYVAGYTDFVYDYDEFGNPYPAVDAGGNVILQNYPAYTEKIADSLKWASWISFGLHLGVKYAF